MSISLVVAFADTQFKAVPIAPVNAQELNAVMGVSSWAMSLKVKAEANRQVMVYAVKKGKPPILLVAGSVIRNDKNYGELSKRIIVIIDGLEVRPWQPKLRIGVGVSIAHTVMTNTVVVKNPIPDGIPFMREQGVLQKDSKGRVMLVQGNTDGVNAFPGVGGQEYAIYVVLAPWNPKK